MASRVVADVSVYVLFGHFDGMQDFEVKCRLVFSAISVSIPYSFEGDQCLPRASTANSFCLTVLS